MPDLIESLLKQQLQLDFSLHFHSFRESNEVEYGN